MNTMKATVINHVGATDPTSEIVSLQINGKPGGEIVRVPMIDATSQTAHITVNTGIKAALSRQVLEAYLAGTLTFDLKTIDPTIKQDKVLTVSKLADVEVHITGFYYYVL